MRTPKNIGSSLVLAAVALSAGLAFMSCTQNAGSITNSRYALVYGVSRYQTAYEEASYYESNPYPSSTGYPPDFNNLSYSDNDGVDLAALMSKQGWNVLSRIKGTSDTTSQLPTKAQMVADLLTIASEVNTDSTVFLYFSGHGTQSDDGTSYIVPYEGIADSTTYSLDLTKCISPSDLSSMLSVLPTQNVIVIFDTCFSGGFVDSGSAIDSSPSKYAEMQSYSAFSTAMANFGSLLVANAAASGSKTPIVISAAGSNEYSYDGNGNGVFTGYLLDSATNGDSNSDGYVTTTEVYAYTAKKIKAYDEENSYSINPFLPHLSGGTRDLVLFTD